MMCICVNLTVDEIHGISQKPALVEKRGVCGKTAGAFVKGCTEPGDRSC